jgi:hypothetical protein
MLEAASMPVVELQQTAVETPSPPVSFVTMPSPIVPVGFVPTPTIEYRALRKARRATIQTGPPTAPSPIPVPVPLPGARILAWKQDPSVGEIGIRKAFLPGNIFAGPKDARLSVQGLATVSPNAMGDLIEAPGTDAFDAVHTFAVVRETLTMYQRALGSPLPWQWNSGGNTDPLQVFPHAGVTMNAFYSRQLRALKFFFFNKPGDPPGPPWNIFTCRSLDIVAHETGHAILDGLQPGWLGGSGNPQTGGLHESFGDLTAIFLALSQLDQVEGVIAQTKANLHDKTFLSDLAEQFGLALGRPNGLRNADNDFKLSEVGTEVHSISQVFTGGIYDVLADIFAFEHAPGKRDDAIVLYQVAEYLRGLVLRALIAAPTANAGFADVVNKMLVFAASDGKPVEYRNFIRNRFTLREVVVSPTPLDVDHREGRELEPAVPADPEAVPYLQGTCGTMHLAEYRGAEEALNAEITDLRKSLGNGVIASLRNGRRPAGARRK